MWILFWDIEYDCLSFRISGNCADQTRPPRKYHLELLRIFNGNEHLMRGNRELLSDDRGVMYFSGQECVLWSFRNFSIVLPNGGLVVEPSGETRSRYTRLDCSARRVYRLSARQPKQLADALRNPSAAVAQPFSA